MLGGDTSSRIWMRLREKEGLSYGAGAWTTADPFEESGSFGAYAIVAPQNLAKAKASILEEIQKMQSGKTTPEELQRTKESWVKAQDTQLSDDSTVAFMLRSQLYRGRTAAHTKELRAKLAALTAADLERVAQKRLDPKRLVIVDAGDLAKAKAADANTAPNTPKP
jgi:zinc protease